MLTSIPTAPARALPQTPKTKPTASLAPSPVIPKANAMITARTAAAAKTTVYSRRRKAIAPSRMAAAISRIRSVPSSSRRTRKVWTPAYARPTSAARRMSNSSWPVDKSMENPGNRDR